MKKIIISFLAIGLIASSCKKNDDYFKKDDIGFKSGFIKANIGGTSQDNIALNESFTAEYVSATDLTRSSSYSIDENGNTAFDINRSSGLFSENKISLSITKFKSGTFSITRFSLTYQKKIDEKQVLSLDYYDYNGSSTSSITNLLFDETTGSLKGSYSITEVKYNNIGGKNTATIAGDFDVVVVKVVN